MPRPDEPTVRPVPLPSRWILTDPPVSLRGALDQVTVGPGGVLTLTRWPGRIGVRGGVIRSGGSRDGLEVADVVVAAGRLADHLQEAHRPVTAALVVVPGKQPPRWVSPGAIVIGTRNVASTLERLDTHLGPDDVADVLHRLAVASRASDDGLPTVANLTARLAEDRARKVGVRRG